MTAKRLKVFTTLHRAEDPEIVAHLSEVEGDDRSMRVRRLLREGYRALYSAPQGRALPPAAPVSLETPPPQTPNGLDGLGLNFDEPFQLAAG